MKKKIIFFIIFSLSLNAFSQSGPTIALGGSRDGVLNPGGRHLITVVVPFETQLTAYTESDIDTIMRIFDASGREIASDDDSGVGLNALISIPVSAGTYTIEVSGFRDTSGPYTLYVSSPFIYEIMNETIIIIGLVRRGSAREVVIPDRINNIPVTFIGGNAFNSNQLTSIIIPNSVTHIGNWAFADNQLTSITIPNSVTYIYVNAFSSNQLTSITIPNNVIFIGDGAFTHNPDLTAINVSPDNPNYSSIDGVLYNKDGTTLLQWPTGKPGTITIPNSVTSIGNYAFADNQLTSITIPNSVTHIGNWSFFNNQLTSITIPSSVTSIGGWAFAHNQLTSITIPSSVTSIGDMAFARNQLTSITIPNSVTHIGDWAFDENVRIIRR